MRLKHSHPYKDNLIGLKTIHIFVKYEKFLNTVRNKYVKY